MNTPNFLYNRPNYETLRQFPTSDQALNLGRMAELARRLGDPQRDLNIVHVAGTKGKGSTCAMIAAVAHAAGLTTGLYSSPHVRRIEERIQIDGAPCLPEQFDRWAEIVRPAVEQMDKQSDRWGTVTFFETLTALALVGFRESRADLVVLETGLGGRRDATNICSPLITAITSIGLEHTAVLGDTLEAIAAEKGGIIKPGVPVILGELEDGSARVLREIARQNDAPILQYGQDFTATYHDAPGLTPTKNNAICFDYRSASKAPQTSESKLTWNFDAIPLGLVGEHQAQNAAVALAVLETWERSSFGNETPPICKTPPICRIETAIRQGLGTLSLPGRIDLREPRTPIEPLIVIDTAHTEASARQLADFIKGRKVPRKQATIVFACAEDKDARAILQPLYPYFENWILTQFTNNPRSSDPQKLANIAFSLDQSALDREEYPYIADSVLTSDSAAEAMLAACQKENQRLICVVGSFYLASEVYQWLDSSST